MIPNVWGMNHDTSIFPEPHLFRPERFLDAATGTIDTAPPDTHGMGHVTYGFGRRICVGFNFANQALFINFATLLWALDIRPVVDPSTGKELIPDPDACVDAGVVVYVFSSLFPLLLFLSSRPCPARRRYVWRCRVAWGARCQASR